MAIDWRRPHCKVKRALPHRGRVACKINVVNSPPTCKKMVGKSAHPGPEESLIISMLRQARLNLSDPQQQKRLMR